MATGGEEFGLEAGLNHPPSQEALEADQTCDTCDLDGHSSRDFSSCNEVYCWEDEGEAYNAAPDSMCPLHVIYLLELLQCDLWIQ